MNSDSISQVFEYLNKRDECPTDNDYNGNIGTRISSILSSWLLVLSEHYFIIVIKVFIHPITTMVYFYL